MQRLAKSSLLLLTCCFLLGGSLVAKIKFNRDVRPILSENCFQCHGPD
ncbi:uncharacterized protein METZ01_LOCUS335057, partial [marine metagenome]